jgi:hypothetical protein
MRRWIAWVLSATSPAVLAPPRASKSLRADWAPGRGHPFDPVLGRPGTVGKGRRRHPFDPALGVGLAISVRGKDERKL